MKKKYLAAILGVMIATTSVTACGAATTETTTNTTESSENKETEDTKAESEESADADKEDSDEEDVTYGEVKSVEDGKITIAVGTMKEMGGNGGASGGDQGGAPDGNNSQSETIELSDIQEGDIVAITTDDDGNALTIKVQSSDMGGGQGGPGGAPGGQSQGVDSYDAANTYDSDTEVSDTSLESTGTDENAALVSSGANVTFDNVNITRNSSDSTGGDNSSFYGVGAALLATDGNVYVEGDSDYTITVDKYEDTADTSGSDTVASWSDYEVEKPDTL